jgi:hypothetical protein
MSIENERTKRIRKFIRQISIKEKFKLPKVIILPRYHYQRMGFGGPTTPGIYKDETIFLMQEYGDNFYTIIHELGHHINRKPIETVEQLYRRGKISKSKGYLMMESIVWKTEEDFKKKYKRLWKKIVEE